jgi:hypothetical protein
MNETTLWCVVGDVHGEEVPVEWSVLQHCPTLI